MGLRVCFWGPFFGHQGRRVGKDAVVKILAERVSGSLFTEPGLGGLGFMQAVSRQSERERRLDP